MTPCSMPPRCNSMTSCSRPSCCPPWLPAARSAACWPSFRSPRFPTPPRSLSRSGPTGRSSRRCCSAQRRESSPPESPARCHSNGPATHCNQRSPAESAAAGSFSLRRVRDGMAHRAGCPLSDSPIDIAPRSSGDVWRTTKVRIACTLCRSPSRRRMPRPVRWPPASTCPCRARARWRSTLRTPGSTSWTSWPGAAIPDMPPLGPTCPA